MTGPKVTLADIEGEIVAEHYFTAHDAAIGQHTTEGGPVSVMHPNTAENGRRSAQALRLLTFCVLVLRNGFTVTAESACVSPDNFDAELGRGIARKKAIDKLWPLLGFRLQDRLATAMSWFNEPGKIDPQAWDEMKAGIESHVGVPAKLHGVDHHSADALAYLMQGEREREHQLNTERTEVMGHVAKAEAPAPSADELAESIADAAKSYHRCRTDEHHAQRNLDDATECRRELLTHMAQATQDREQAAEKLLAATDNARGKQEPQLTSWQNRLEAELREVCDRLHKLNGFLGSPAFMALPEGERDLLEQQHTSMAAYAEVLGKRLDAAEA